MIEELLQGWLGDAAVVVSGAIDADAYATLWPEEQWHVQKAVAKRQNEFATARHLAREALARLQYRPCALLPYPDRSPAWPEGIVGSISHTLRDCVVVLGRSSQLRGVGVDLEEYRPVDPGMMEMIMRPEERRRWSSASPEEQQRQCLATFCAKEAFYKFQSPLTGEFLDFQDVVVSDAHDELGFRVHIDVTRSPAAKRVHAQLGEHKFRGWWTWVDAERVIALVAQITAD